MLRWVSSRLSIWLDSDGWILRLIKLCGHSRVSLRIDLNVRQNSRMIGWRIYSYVSVHPTPDYSSLFQRWSFPNWFRSGWSIAQHVLGSHGWWLVWTSIRLVGGRHVWLRWFWLVLHNTRGRVGIFKMVEIWEGCFAWMLTEFINYFKWITIYFLGYNSLCNTISK